MTSISATALRQNLYKTIEQVNNESKPVSITNSKGKGAVLIGEDDWAAIEETLYLMSIPGMAESIIKEASAPEESYVPSDDLDW